MGTVEKSPHLPQEVRDEVDIPEATEADFARAKPFEEIFPNQVASRKRERGRPLSETPEVHIGFRRAADVVQGIEATGRGYNARVEKVLREALAKGKLRAESFLG